MSNNTVVSLRQPDEIDDPLTAVLRSGARRLLAQAIEAEAEAFLVAMRDKRLADGRERVVRHGHGPERLVQTAGLAHEIAPVEQPGFERCMVTVREPSPLSSSRRI